MKRLPKALVVGCSVALLSQASHASPFSALIVFGDSLSDAGQYSDPNAPPNSTIRNTNRTGPSYLPDSGELTGAVAPMVLNQQLGLKAQTPSSSAIFQSHGWSDGDNWAVGGHRTDQVRDSMIAPGGGSTLQRSRDGYLVELAAKGQRISPNSLFYINAGANDVLQKTIYNLGAQASADQLVDGIQALQGAGARTIMVALLHDISASPRLIGSPDAAAASAIVPEFNNALVSGLGQVKAQVIPLNTPRLFEQVLSNPSAYGFDPTQDQTGSCFANCNTINSQWGINSATPNPNKLIYADSIHPSTAMHQILGNYAYSLLAAPWELSLLPEMGQSLLRGHQAQVRQQWRNDWLTWQAPNQWRTFINLGSENVDFDRQSASVKSKSESFGLNLGASYRLDQHWRMGLALAVDEQDLKAGHADSKYHMRGYLLSGFAQYQSEHWWSDLLLSAGYLDYHSLKRRYQLGIRDMSEKGNSAGQTWGSTWRIGYEIAKPTDNWRLSPFVSADYANSKVNAYHESGYSASALQVAKQSRDSKRLGLGLQGSWQVSEQTLLSAELSRQHEYNDDQQQVRMSLTSVPSLSYQLAGYQPKRHSDVFNLALKHQLQPALALFAGYNLNRNGDQRQYGVNLGVQLDW